MGYYNSFVIRIWSNDHGWTRGKIEHVTSHDSLVFSNLAEIDDFVRRHLIQPVDHVPDSSEELGDDDFLLDVNLTDD